MKEPLEKDLGFNITAKLDASGNLTLTEVAHVEIDGQMHELPTLARVELPAQATRSLHNLLRTETARTYTGYRKQKEGKRHVTHQTRRLGHLWRFIRRWARQTPG